MSFPLKDWINLQTAMIILTAFLACAGLSLLKDLLFDEEKKQQFRESAQKVAPKPTGESSCILTYPCSNACYIEAWRRL